MGPRIVIVTIALALPSFGRGPLRPLTATISLAALVVVGPLAAQLAAQRAAQPAAHVQHDVGTVRLATSCAASTQPAFARAVALLHSFAFAQATTEFTGVLRTDPQGAMAWWGLALSAWGNPFTVAAKPRAQIERGRAAVQRARAAGAATPREQGYIDAVAQLYEHADTLPQRVRLIGYRDAMSALAAREPADTEAQIFRALAVAIAADPTDKTYAAQLEAGATLERLFAKLPDHPGLAHNNIHAYDVAPLAGRALDAATRYGRIAPDVSHALHMPSHTYTRVGLWQPSIVTNIASASAARREGSTAEELHSSDYRMYAYLQLGQDRAAARLLAAIPAIARRLDPAVISTGASPASGTFAIAAIPARYALDRGDWKGAARLEVHATAVPYADAITWFARALGAARSGDTASADSALTELARLRELLAGAKEGYWTEQVEIQRLAASAWRSFAAGQRAPALAAMRVAADREDATEKSAVTPGPLAPARELLGDLLMEAGAYADARAAYDATMAKEPKRFRAIAGSARAAMAAGDSAAARERYRALLALAAHADKPGRPALVEAAQAVGPTP